MNPPADTETLQKFAFEGPLPIGPLIALGGAAALLVAFLAWRDYKAIASRKLFFLLVIPRIAALAVALWMLAGPTAMTVSRAFKPKSIIVMADGSGSMGLADAADGAGSALQWSDPKECPDLAAVNKALGELRAAQLLAASRASNSWEQIRHSVDLAADDLQKVHSDADPRMAAFLKDGTAQLSAPSPGKTKQDQDERADEVAAFIENAARRADRLSQKIAAQYEQSSSGKTTQPPREEKVIDWLSIAEGSWLKDLGGKMRVLRYKFASNILPVAGPGWRDALRTETNLDTRGTDLGAALNQASQDAGRQPVEAIVMVTDGGQNGPTDPREAAAALRGVPLFVVPIGSSVIPRDVILHHLQCAKAAFKNDTVMIDAMITAYECAGEKIRVELSSDGAVVDSQMLAATSAVFDGRVSFKWKAAELGRHTLKVHAVPVARELSADNNDATAEIEVMEDTIRVLLADDLPRWEFRYLSMLFKRDKHVGFDQLLFEPNDDASSAPQSFPQDADGWRKYRVVILGDVTPAELPVAQQEQLRNYVARDGGNLIVIAGETAMPSAFAGQPLDGMLPVTASNINPDQPFNLAVTGEGSVSVPTQLEDDPAASERIWRETSARLPIYNLSPNSRAKPTAHVLISAATAERPSDQRAFLSWQYVGLGRVIYIAAPITYELRYGIGDFFHHRFWGQLLRWAIAREMAGGSKTVHLLADKNRYEAGDSAQIALRLTGADGAPVPGAKCGVQAFQNDKSIKTIEMREDAGSPGSYRGIFSGLPTGQITLRAGGATVQSLLASEGFPGAVEQLINIDIKGSTEMSVPICNLPLLNQIADASGGAVVPPGAVQYALANLNTTPDSEETVLNRRPLWDRWAALWIIIGCITIEWLAKRHWRMI
jgi:hypothetical protein